MNHTTQGIVLDYIKYADHAIIVRLYSLHFGLHSYLVRGIRKQKQASIGAFQPLVRLQIVVNHKARRTLQYIKEVHIQPQQYSYAAAKQAHKLLLVEVLNQILAPYEEPRPDVARFDFFQQSLHVFHDCVPQQAWLVVAQFLAKLTLHSGIFLLPQPLFRACHVFDPAQGDVLAQWIQTATHAPYLADISSVFVKPAIYFFIQHYAKHFGASQAMHRVAQELGDYF